MRRRSVPLLAASVLLAASLQAQHIAFRHLGVDDGLPSSLVSHVLQDRRGFIWIGTAQGVSRYDGHDFRTYAPARGGSDGLQGAMIDDLHEDHTGRIWAVTAQGLSRYEGSRDDFISYRGDSIVARAGPWIGRAGAPRYGTRLRTQVTSVNQDRSGRVLVGTSVGLFALDPASGAAVRVPLSGESMRVEPPYITALFEDRTGEIWVGTRTGLFTLGTAAQSSTGATAGRGALRLPALYVRALSQDSQGHIWVGTYGKGIVRYDPQSAQHALFQHDSGDPRSLGSDRVMRIVHDRVRGGMWIAVENAGLDYIGPDSKTFVHHRHDPNDPGSLRSNSVWALYQDQGGLLWAGTFSGGLDISMRSGHAIKLFQSLRGDPTSLSFNAVPAFAEDRHGAMWIATDGGGVNRMAPTSRRLTRFTVQNAGLTSDAVLSIAPDDDGSVWLATWAGGLNHLDVATRRTTAFTTANSNIPDDNLYEVLRTRRGDLWVGTDNGMVAQFDRAHRRFDAPYRLVAPGLDPSSVLLLRELADGRLVAGLRDGGITILDTRTGARRYIAANPRGGGALASNSVHALWEASPGTLWIGTDAGIDIVELRTGAHRHLGTSDGLASNTVLGIVGDAMGQVWISTDRGITRRSSDGSTAHTLTRLDGLQGNEFLMRSAFRSRDGTLYFGGNQGFNAIHPKLVIADERAPRVVFTNLLLFNKLVTPTSKHSPLLRAFHETRSLRLSHAQNVVTFEFAALDFSAPEKAQYAYRLVGFDEDWQLVGTQHAASYTNLAPGTYTLEVRAANGDGVWNENATSLALIIEPPLWGTWWARITMALLGVGGVVRLWRFQQQRRLEIALSRQALHDALTGLANRVLFHDRVVISLQRLTRANRMPSGVGEVIADPKVAVLFLDLDNFKHVNDSLGHHAGDQLLRIVSSRLLNATRGCDTVARLGGDEFAVLLENMRAADDAYVVADRITAALRQPVPVGDEEHPREASVSASIGIAFMNGPLDATDLLRNADAAMYRAKAEGKGRYVVFDPELVAADEERLDLEHGIALARAHDELSLAYQPIIDVATGAVVGAEALMRWMHPTRGAISPARFIPLAEASGVILDIGQWALGTACNAAAQWPRAASGEPLSVSVNVSWRQLMHPHLLAEVQSALDASGLRATQLTLEITESVLMQDTATALRILCSLKALGVRLAVDDFGTGYSSLRYLQQFPIDVLKIDKSFVDHLASRPQDAALARMIIGLGDSLGLAMVAEGVEHEAQRERLLAMGCRFAQGYLFARPLPAAELQALLTSGHTLSAPVHSTTTRTSGNLQAILTS